MLTFENQRISHKNLDFQVLEAFFFGFSWLSQVKLRHLAIFPSKGMCVSSGVSTVTILFFPACSTHLLDLLGFWRPRSLLLATHGLEERPWDREWEGAWGCWAIPQPGSAVVWEQRTKPAVEEDLATAQPPVHPSELPSCWPLCLVVSARAILVTTGVGTETRAYQLHPELRLEKEGNRHPCSTLVMEREPQDTR